MNTFKYRNTGIAAFAAVVIVGLSGLTLDRGHGLPQGVIEVGEPVTLAVGDLLVAELPTVEVIAARDVRFADATAHAEPQG